MQTLTQNGDDHDGEDETWDSEDDVYKAHQYVVDPATEKPGDATDDNADKDAEPGDGDAYVKGRACAPDKAVIDVVTAAGGA